ncbi:MAG TPA: triose-phosphate isomerase [Candidatus Saccharimonadales bacterium]|nr:triose-phosphate isomerase [Candidatus Saccharimonadales bacterium]
MSKKRKVLIIGNWKMHLNISQASLLVSRLDKHVQAHNDVEVVLAPSMLDLQPVSIQIDRRKFRLAAQNAYYEDEGAYTGEVSFNMLRDLAHYVIIGHSERRIHFNEGLENIRDKVAACVRNGITPVLCVGETKAERNAGETRRVLHDQLVTALSDLTAEEVTDMVIAYEPVWAISTFEGEIAKPDIIEKDISFIRKQVSELYGDQSGSGVRVIYGGSVDDHSAGTYIRVKGCDGVLPGGASINYHKFAKIVETAHKIAKEEDASKKI